MSENQEVTQDEIAKIRGLDDFDLIMLISEIHDHGWLEARCTLVLMPPAGDQAEYREKKKKSQPVLIESEETRVNVGADNP